MTPRADWIRGVRDGTWARAAWVAWIAVTSVLLVHVGRALARNPDIPFVNVTYETASRAWEAGEPIYRPLGYRGFLYLPVAAVLYVPFTKGPAVVRHLVERGLYTGLLVAALWVVSARLRPDRRGLAFLVLTLATLPLAVQNVRQGQTNLALAGCLLLAVAALHRKAHGRAAAALGLGVALKPLGVVFALLAGAVWWRRLGPGLLVAALAVAALPFAFASPGYVIEQIADFGRKMAASSDPATPYYDVRGLLETGLGVHVPHATLTALRAIAALGALALALRWRRTAPETRLVFDLYALSASFVMLFSPKTEDPTYLLLAPAIGVSVLEALLDRRQPRTAITLALLPFALALSFELLGGRRYWFRPLLALLYAVYLVATRSKREEPLGSAASIR